MAGVGAARWWMAVGMGVMRSPGSRGLVQGMVSGNISDVH
jgi:hypothetical protein